MADMTFSCARLRCPRCSARQAGACWRKMSATSREGRPTAGTSGRRQRLQRAEDLVQQIGGHVGVHGGGLQALVSEQHLDDADVNLALQQVRGEAMPPMSLKR